MKKAILPVLVIVLAVTSAFTRAVASKNRVTLVPGFLPHNIEGTNCEYIEDCSTTNLGTFCRVGQVPTGQRLFGLNANDECLLTVYKP